MPLADWDLVVIDNALPEDHVERIGPQHVLIGGRNSDWEFSSWDSGIAYIGSRLLEYDFVHLATSAFRTLYTRYLDRIDERMLALIRARAAAIGHIDYYPEPVVVQGVQSQAWLRSSFIFLPPVELMLLGSLVSCRDEATLFSDCEAVPFRGDAPVSENYRRYLLDWLTGEGTGQGVQWHSRFSITRETLPCLQQKIIAILNEHLLGIRLRAQGCSMVDATWLATRAKALPPAERCLGPIPSWRMQLAGRDRDPVSPALLLSKTS
jgi:hypothetical protein